MMSLGERVGGCLRCLRLRRNYTLEAVAEDLRISASSLSAYELGHRPLTLDMFSRLAEYYEVASHMVLAEAAGQVCPACSCTVTRNGSEDALSLPLAERPTRVRASGRRRAQSKQRSAQDKTKD